MNNGILVFRDEEIESAISGLDKVTVDLTDTGQTIPNKFSQMTNTGLFSGGINKINKQISSLTTSISGIETTLKKHTNQMIESELKYKSKAEQIEIPRDFINTEAKEVHTIDDIYLQKKDGTSVNEGQVQGSIDELKEYTIIEENLGSIANLRETDTQLLDDSTKLKKTIINNVDNNTDSVQQIYDDSSSIQKEEFIYDMNKKSNSVEQVTFDESMFDDFDESLLKEFEELRW